MDRKNIYLFDVPGPLMVNWKYTKGGASFYYKNEKARGEKFVFPVPDDLDGEKIGLTDIINKADVSFLIDAMEGKLVYNRNSIRSAWSFYSYILTQEVLHDESRMDFSKEENNYDGPLSCLDELVRRYSYENGGVTTSVAKLAFENYLHDAEYICDMSVCLLKAPEGKGFAIGDFPLLFFNPFQSGRETEYAEVFDGYGLIIAVPISPSYALCFYDDFVYKVRKSSGIAQLDRDDIDSFNAVTVYQSSAVLYDSEVTTKRNLDLLYGMKKNSIVSTVGDREYFKLELSPFSIRARAEDDIVEKGRIPERRYSAVERYSTFGDKTLHEEIMEKYLSKYDS